jgi:hypothetical protein
LRDALGEDAPTVVWTLCDSVRFPAGRRLSARFAFLIPGAGSDQWGTVFRNGVPSMTRHHLMHLALAAVYFMTAAILCAQAAYAHAACAALAAAIYGLLAWPVRRGG